MIYLILLLAILSRFVPHLDNAVPITAIAIFAGAYLPKKQAIALPLAARFVSDIFLGFFAWQQMLVVYAAHLFGLFLGFWIKKSKDNKKPFWIKVGLSGLISAVVFFLATNLALLYPVDVYSHNLSGIISAYINGLPFLRGTFIGDVGYTLALFSAYELAMAYKGRKIISVAS